MHHKNIRTKLNLDTVRYLGTKMFFQIIWSSQWKGYYNQSVSVIYVDDEQRRDSDFCLPTEAPRSAYIWKFICYGRHHDSEAILTADMLGWKGNSHSHGSAHMVTYGELTLFMHHCTPGLSKRRTKTKVYPGQHNFLLTSNSGRLQDCNSCSFSLREESHGVSPRDSGFLLCRTTTVVGSYF